MEKKKSAYQLHLAGHSYKQIATELGIGKTTAFNYVKEVKLQNSKRPQQSVQHSSELMNEQSSEWQQKRSEPKNPIQKEPKVLAKQKTSLKEFTGHDLVKKKFDCLEFEGKFKELIGKPSRIFSAIIWGLPKGGKSNLALRFADYLQEYFGKTVYIAAEEGESVTLQDKFKDIGGSGLTVVESRNRDDIREYLKLSDAEFVFIDSINTAGIDNDYLELLKEENVKKSFVGITQATKGGTFKGDQALTHNCDFIIKVVNGVAYHTGRFNVASEIKIFEDSLYEKNPNKAQLAIKYHKESQKKNVAQFPTLPKNSAKLAKPIDNYTISNVKWDGLNRSNQLTDANQDGKAMATLIILGVALTLDVIKKTFSAKLN